MPIYHHNYEDGALAMICKWTLNESASINLYALHHWTIITWICTTTKFCHCTFIPVHVHVHAYVHVVVVVVVVCYDAYNMCSPALLATS